MTVFCIEKKITKIVKIVYVIKLQTIIRVSTQTGMKDLNKFVVTIYVTMAMPALINTCTIRAQRTVFNYAELRRAMLPPF